MNLLRTGMLMAAKALLDRNPSPSRDEVVEAISGNLCRCTGYTKIFEAIDLLVADEVAAPQTPQRNGDSGGKYEGIELALGERGYVDDIRPEGLLHGALRLTDHARAVVMRIDTSAADASSRSRWASL